MKPALLFVGGLALGLLIGYLIWETSHGKSLRVENMRLIEQVKAADALRAENSRLAGERVDPDEMEKLRDGQTELLRLRGQVSQLRREVEEAKTAAATVGRQTPPATETDQTPEEVPVDRFDVKVSAIVGWKQSLVAGGWRLPSGKRAFVFLEPSADAGENSVNVRSRIVELPEELLSHFGLDAFTSKNPASTGNGILTAEQVQSLFKSLEKAEGVTLLGAPQVTTSSGNQAQIAITESHTLPSGQVYSTGPVIDVVPTISADKQTVVMVVNAQLNLPREKK